MLEKSECVQKAKECKLKQTDLIKITKYKEYTINIMMLIKKAIWSNLNKFKYSFMNILLKIIKLDKPKYND